MALALGSLAVVEGRRRRAEAGGDLGGKVEAPQEPTVVAVWSTHVAADATGVPQDRCETGDSGEAAGAAEGVHVPAGAGDELRPQQRAQAS